MPRKPKAQSAGSAPPPQPASLAAERDAAARAEHAVRRSIALEALAATAAQDIDALREAIEKHGEIAGDSSEYWRATMMRKELRRLHKRGPAHSLEPPSLSRRPRPHDRPSTRVCRHCRRPRQTPRPKPTCEWQSPSSRRRSRRAISSVLRLQSRCTARLRRRRTRSTTRSKR